MTPARQHPSHDHDELPAALRHAQSDLAAYIHARVSTDSVLLKIMQAPDDPRDTSQDSAAADAGSGSPIPLAPSLSHVSDDEPVPAASAAANAPPDDELAEYERWIGVDLSALPRELRWSLVRYYAAIDARMQELERQARRRGA